MKRLLSVILCTAIMLICVGCSSNQKISYDAYEKLIKGLENMGYKVESKDVEKSILSGERKWLTLNENENISVYLYENNEKMEEDASYLSFDGGTYNNGKNSIIVEWVSYPHFFKSENMIVLYVGENTDIVSILEELVGPQFAGYYRQ
ncbi:MAG TPA: hypothetical protein VIK77_10250 [Tissierellaceae bacterium]